MEMSFTGLASSRIDSVKVLALGEHLLDEDTHFIAKVVSTGKHWNFPVLGEGTCSSIQVCELVELWNALPDAEQARCHIPGFAIQVLKATEVVFTASLCWHCNNISIASSLATLGWRQFDASSLSARRRLSLCKEIVASGA